MKSLLNYVNKEAHESQDPIREDLDPKTKAQLDKVRKDIEKVLKSMELGNFKYEITSERVTFELGRRYDFWIELNRLDDVRGMTDLRFSSIASYGGFRTGDETYEFYKSLGVLLSQEDKLEQIRQLFLETRKIARNAE